MHGSVIQLPLFLPLLPLYINRGNELCSNFDYQVGMSFADFESCVMQELVNNASFER